MCGFTGILHWGTVPDAADRSLRMVKSIFHRGPDDEGMYHAPEVSLGHVRLSILDLDGGAQPMGNEDGQIQVVYNGEIYNHRTLRKELLALGHTFSTDHCDTEILVHAYESWGPDFIQRLNGMFAFALWDARRNILLLARDRYGIKPLYYAKSKDSNTFVFASEARALFASGLIEKNTSTMGLFQYLTFQNYIGEQTMFEGVFQFPAGYWETRSPERILRHQYWDFSFSRSRKQTLSQAVGEYRERFQDAVSRQIDSDVPVSTYLSGGIDSSGITAIATQLNPEISAYTCVFDLTGVGEDKIMDEREYAAQVADHLNINHTVVELPQESLEFYLDSTMNALEYPRMGMSYVNYLIAGQVSKESKVVLSGLGGDEVQAGYVGRYQLIQQNIANSPGWWERMRNQLRKPKRRKTYEAWDGLYFRMLNAVVPVTEYQRAFTPEFYAQIRDFNARDLVQPIMDACPSRDPFDILMYTDAKTYLHGLLVLEDKLSMSHSLEARVPLLDNELVDYLLTLPWPYLFDENRGKIVFRDAVQPFLPNAIYQKPKMGFGPPDASWYRGTLRQWITQQLSPETIADRGIFQEAYVMQKLDEHFSGVQNHVYFIWSLLSLESWFRVFNSPNMPYATSLV